MKNKGFTLVELLAVIIILGLLLLITMISVNSILNSSKESLSETQKKRLEDAAEVYYLEEGMNRDSKCVSIEYLVLMGYLNSDEVLDPKTREPLEGSIAITYDSNRYSYEFQDDECLMQIFKPQYYFFGTEYLIGSELPWNATEDPSEIEFDFYLGVDSMDGETISATFLCFNRNGSEYCLKGVDPNQYKINIEILKSAYEDMLDVCTFGNEESSCDYDSKTLSITSTGKIVFDDSYRYYQCQIDLLDGGYLWCDTY